MRFISLAWFNWVKSMLAPVKITATFFPLISCFILVKPARPKAPEGSLIIPIEYNFMTIWAIIPSEIVTNPSTEVFAKSRTFWFVYLTELPLQNLLAFYAPINLLFFIELENGVAISVSTEITLVSGLVCLKKLAIELTNPPPPVGTTT